MTKHDSKACKVDPGDRVTLAPCKQVLKLKSRTLFKNQHIIMEDRTCIPTQKGLEIQDII